MTTSSDPSAQRVQHPLVEVRGVSKVYGSPPREIWALQDVTLGLDPGEFVAVMGPSGAGKSTLVHLLGGLEYPSAGRIFFDGQDLTDLSDVEISRIRLRHIGLVLQFPTLVSALTVAENVALPAQLERLSRNEYGGQLEALLAQVGLLDRRDHYPYELSGGEQQRAVVARALFFEPKLLLADEPTAHLDSRLGREILELLLYLRAELGVAMLIATHDAGIASLADRVLHLIDGKKVGELSLDGIGQRLAASTERRRAVLGWIDAHS